MTTVNANKLPTIAFEAASGGPLLSVRVGKTQSDLFIMSDVEGAPAPTIQAFVAKGPEANLDVAIPVAMVAGGSDCEYEATVVGMTNGRPKEWLPSQEFINTEGGYYVGDLGNGRGYGFAAWNFLWEDGAHYEPHRYEVTLYRFEPRTGRAIRIARLETKRKYDTDEGALRELDLKFNNLLRTDPSFGC